MIVLDSSAVLAVLRDEPGADFVLERSQGAAISTVNLAEVMSTIAGRGGDIAVAKRNVGRLRMRVIPFDAAQAERVGELRPLTRHLSISLGDRACLALAEKLGASALTVDRPWRRLELGVKVELIR